MAISLRSLLGSRPVAFAAVGSLTGVASGAISLFVELGDAWAPEIGGYCYGLRTTSGSPCHGVDLALYVFPGLVFGVVFGPLLRRLRAVGNAAAAATYAVAATFANALAIFVCLSTISPLTAVMPDDSLEVELALTGILGGAAGGGVLSAVLRRLSPGCKPLRVAVTAAVLGALTPVVIMLDRGAGVFPFYMLWQAGYAATLATSLPHRG